MKKLKAKIGLVFVQVGLFIMSLGDKEEYDDDDRYMLKELHKLRYDFSEALNDNR